MPRARCSIHRSCGSGWRGNTRARSTNGLGQLKKTLGMRYFTFALPAIMAQSLVPAGRDWLRRPAGNPLAGRMAEDHEGPPELKYSGAIGKLYTIYAALLHGQTAARRAALRGLNVVLRDNVEMGHWRFPARCRRR